MTEIYLDVLVGLNIYITWALFDCCELLGHIRAKRSRKCLASLAGGMSSLLILLPEMGMVTLALLRLGLAAGLTFIAFGFRGKRHFLRTVFLFFAVNFLFAGTMIALWLMAAPSGMAIRNGVVYFHLSALTLVISTVAASLAAKGLSFLFFRRKPEKLIETIRLTVDGNEAELRVFLDTGNRLLHHGLPVIACSEKVLSGVLPAGFAAVMTDLSAAAALPGRWKRRLRMVLCETAAGSKLLPAFLPDRVTRPDGTELRCLVALTGGKFCGG